MRKELCTMGVSTAVTTGPSPSSGNTDLPVLVISLPNLKVHVEDGTCLKCGARERHILSFQVRPKGPTYEGLCQSCVVDAFRVYMEVNNG